MSAGAPPRYEPMLATPWVDPFDDPDWWFEVKWDGYRVMVEWDDRLVLRSRRGNDMTASYPEAAGLRFDRPTVVDGELVVFGSDGRPDFGRLQQRNGLTGAAARRGAAAHPVTLVAFDLPYHGEPLIDLPIEERRRRLSALGVDGLVPDPVRGEGVALFDAVRRSGLEGVVAKRAGSAYRPGRRGADWRKLAVRRKARVVVGGYTPGESGRAGTFGGLQVGLVGEGGLRHVGSVGSGFDEASLRAIREALDQMSCDESPFQGEHPAPKETRYVVPVLAARVEYQEWTHGGKLRKPVFDGFVDDPVESLTWETEGPPSTSPGAGDEDR